MRPVKKPAQPGNYPPSPTLTFAGANATAIAANTNPVSAPNTKTFTLAQLVNVWLTAVKSVPPPANGSTLKKAQSAISGRISDIYKAASTPLTQGLGPFCSYCESPLSGLLEVEHCAPKAPYPTYSIEWKNFLLACSPCNNKKSDNPSRAIATAWTEKLNPTEAELYDEIREQHYFFPDTSAGSYTEMPVVLQYLNNTVNPPQWNTVPLSTSANPNNFIVSQDITTRTVIARLYNATTGVPQDVQVQAIVISKTSGLDPDIAQEMIDLCGLNICNDITSTYDRRVMNRTIAWFTALKALNNLGQASGNPGHQAVLWEMTKMIAVSAGFYSVWVKLLVKIFSNEAAKSFVTQTNVTGEYPGTDTSGLPS